MEGEPNCFVSGQLARVLRVSRLAGVAPLRFAKKNNGWRVSVSTWLSIYGHFLVTIFIVLTAGTLISELQVDQASSVRMQTKTRRAVWIVEASQMMVIAGMAVYGSPRQMQSMIACLNQVQKVNSELNIQHWPTYLEEKKISRLFIIWATLAVTLTLTDLVISEITIGNWMCLMYSFYYCCYWILQMREVQMITITLHVGYSFTAVNDGLRSLLYTIGDKQNELPLLAPLNSRLLKDNNIYKTFIVDFMTNSRKIRSGAIKQSTASYHGTVRRLALAYTSLCDVVRDVDRSHGLMVLMMIGTFLLHLVCTPYFFITNMIVSKTITSYSTGSVLILAVQVAWCFFHTFNLVMIIEPCHMTHMEISGSEPFANVAESFIIFIRLHSQMETTRVLLSHLIHCTHSIYDPLAIELEMFYKHFVLNEVSYMPLAVTTMTRALVVTILGSIITYLVIIVKL